MLVSLSLVTLAGQPHALLALQDLTERNLLERQLRQAQKMEAIGQLAAGVAHDFNNMLTVIIGYGCLLLQRTQPDGPDRDYLEQILEAAERAATLTRQLLAFSRKQRLSLQELDLNEIVAGMDKMLRSADRREYRIARDPVTCRLPRQGRCRTDRAGHHEPRHQRPRRHARRAATSSSKPRW